jgi:hypothetical protein
MTAQPAATIRQESARPIASEARPALSLPRVVAALQVVLATRRAARNVEHAFWHSPARSL